MFGDLNEKLLRAGRNVRTKERLQLQLQQLTADWGEADDKRIDLEKVMQKEKADVDKLEGLSLTGLFVHVFGNKQERLTKEREEFMAAKLRYDETEFAVQAMAEEIKTLEAKLKELAGAEEKYENLLAAKEARLLRQDHPSLLVLVGEIGQKQSELKELEEAEEAGQKAMHELEKTRDFLVSAESWGTFDLLGGGLLSTAIKHDNMDGAKKSALQAQQHLRQFKRELTDLDNQQDWDMGLDLSGFEKFTDYFFDCLIIDWVVLDKISKSKRNTLEMGNKVIVALDKITKQADSCAEQLEELTAKRAAYIAGQA